MNVTAFNDVLEKLNSVYRDMLELAELKRQAIIDNDVDSIIQLMTRETKGVKAIEQLETQRQEMVNAFLQSRGIKSQLQLTMTELVRLVFDQDEKARLMQIQTRLSETLNDLKEKNNLNQHLMKQSLDFIDLSLDLLTGKPAQDMTYQPPTKRSSGAGSPGIFDTRA
ncbi:flagellar protein FlgN [Paenibacillus solani]|uniref:Flagellar biosynthesis protein FlgN n=1 Tax=Paenibacillus solani TaxID=1705565 RepID=A0A0M1N2M3_9BACL|nr:flagellar protein FlgN [Paenibacillus solani]KOR76285.1 flagellar biosynthesis protein FlgN [Paenibacillus solani]